MDHILANETTYQHLAANSVFATKLTCYLDRQVQLHLKSCALAKSINDVPVSSLSFWETKRLIEEGRFDVKLILPIIYKQVRSIKTTPHLEAPVHWDTLSDDDEAPTRTPRTANKRNTGGTP
jgi:hypothetical protein